MNTPLFLGVLGLLGLLYIWIGKQASQNVEKTDDYYLMGRKLSFFPLALTLLATQLGGGTMVGAAQEAYQKGWVVLFYPIGASFGLVILGLGFGARLRNLKISTIAEIFEKVYSSKGQRTFASTLSIVGMFFILVGMVIAIRMFFSSLGITSPIVFGAFWSILVAYTVMGGFKAVVNTDIVQALFIMGCLALVLFTMDTTQVVNSEVAQVATFDSASVPWTAWMLMPFMFMLIEQDMGQRCFSAKNGKTVSRAALASGLLLMIGSSSAIYIGILAKQLGIVASGDKSILVEAVMALTGPTVSTLFMAAVFMAIISTADSLLCSISSNISYDFLEKQPFSEKKKITLSRLITLLTGISTLGLAFAFDSVVGMLMLSYELTVCALFVPVVAAIVTRNPSKQGSFLAIVLGSVGLVLFRFVELPIPREVATLTLSLSGYLIGQRVREEELSLSSSTT